MAKYKKRRPGAEIVEPIFGLAKSCYDPPVEKAVFVNSRGVLDEWYREDFDREYERVEKKALWGRCVRCGCAFVVDDMWDTGPGGFKHCYPECWAGDKLTPKKPTPLTLGDLKPGDVFRLVSHDFCQAKHQLLSAKEFWCSRDRKSITITHSEREVVLIAHHDLTPKQLLWIKADKKERKALDDSIREKWLPRTRGEAKSTGKCALCSRHERAGGLMHQCSDCLLGKAGETCTNAGSPWKSWRNQTRGQAILEDDWAPYSDQEYDTARRMTLSLAAFLPDIDPMRIEVEATPVEWPGGK